MAKQAEVALADDDPELALDYYRQIITHGEAPSYATSGIAQAQLNLAHQQINDPGSDFGIALDAWFAAIPYEGWSPMVRRGLAESYLGLGNSMAAADQWNRAYSIDPSTPYLWYELAPAHLARQEWGAAAHAYEILSDLEPTNNDFHFMAGLLNLSSDRESARSHLQIAGQDATWANRADQLISAIGDLESIDQPAQRAGRLGVAYLVVEEPALAAQQLETSLQLDSSLAVAWAYLGLAKDQLGQNGYRAASRAVELDPSSSLAHSLLGHHWMRGDYFELARAEFSRAAAIEPTNVTHLLDIAHAYQREDDLVSAEVWLQEAVRVQPREEIAWIALARFYLDTSPGDSESGLMAARRAVALAPEDSAALDVLGWAQFLTGRIRLAETNLLAARERDPENSAVCYHLGRLLLEQERIDQAREIFQQILTMDRSCRDCRPVESGPYAALASRELVRLDY